MTKKAIEFTTLNVKANYNHATLRKEDSVEYVGKVVEWLVRTAELEYANKQVDSIKEKVFEASRTGSDVSLVLSKEESETWENFQKHEKTLNEFIEKTEYTEDMWKAENEVDKVFLQLIALPNMPKKFARLDLFSGLDFSKYLNIAEKYYDVVNGKVDTMKNQLEYDFFKLKRGGDIFRGVKIKPNGTDTKKFLALFITDIKEDENGKFDFKVLYADKKKTKKISELVNKFLALYIVNRMNAVTPLSDKEEKEYVDSLKKQEETTPAKTPEKKLSEKTVNRIKNARKKKDVVVETPVEEKEETVKQEEENK